MRWIPTIVVVVVLVGCSSNEPPTPTPGGTSGLSPLPSATPPPSSAPADPGIDRLVVPAAAPSVPAPWVESFVIPYGAGEDRLGTSRGGEAGTLDIGPEYGAPGPDGTWWFLDSAKQRVAHYSAEGTYLDQVRIPRRVLVNRRYFQWSLPHVLGDETLVAVRQEPPDSWLLRVRGVAVDEVRVRGGFAPRTDDGSVLYGSLGRGMYVVVDPVDGSHERVDTFRTASGMRYFVGEGFDNGRLRVELPDAGVAKAVRVRTASGALAHVGSQVVAGADDTIHVFLAGVGEDDESVQLVGYTSVTPAGAVSPVEALPDPFSESDPGSPAQLVIASGSTIPMLVYVLEDGVHVYARTG